MKKLFLLTLVLPFLFSCSKSSGGDTDSTTYTLINKVKLPDAVGAKIDYTLYEYNAKGEKIANHKIPNMAEGASSTFTATTQAEKVKVFYSYWGHLNFDHWVQQVFYLKKGKNITITVSNDTASGDNEP